jgi:UPF0716 family protein affecting phage T7 exclusion
MKAKISLLFLITSAIGCGVSLTLLCLSDINGLWLMALNILTGVINGRDIVKELSK